MIASNRTVMAFACGMEKDHTQVLNFFVSNHQAQNNLNAMPPTMFNCFDGSTVNPDTA